MRAATVVALGAVLYRWLVRERLLNWGANEAEVHAPMPGDELLDDADAVATRAMRTSPGSARGGSTCPLFPARDHLRRCRPPRCSCPAIATVRAVVMEDSRG